MNEKPLPDGTFKYKARLVVCGYQQDFEEIIAETYAPTGAAESVRYLIAHAAQNKWTLEQMDFSTAFIQSDPLEDEDRVLVQLPKGIPQHILEQNGWIDGQTLRLKKPLYGLKRSPLLWNQSIDKKMKLLSFRSTECDSCLYTNQEISLFMFLHVDNLLMSANPSSEIIKETKEKLKDRFDFREEGFPQAFIGIQIQRVNDGSIFIHQTRYTMKILEKFGELEGWTSKIPLKAQKTTEILNLNRPQKEKGELEISYKEFIGSLMWLAKGTRPDILQAVSFLSRFQSNYGPEHWQVCSRVFAYLQGTMGFGILYNGTEKSPLNTEQGDIIGFADANWAENDATRRSTTGFVFGLANGVIKYVSRRQKNIALSSTEAEIYAMTDAAKEATILKAMIRDLKKKSVTLEIICDNQSAIGIGNSAELNKGRTKHIEVREMYIKEAIQKGIVKLVWVPSQENVADIMTKPLAYPLFSKHRKNLGMRISPLGV